MDNEEVSGVKISEFPTAATISQNDTLTGLSGGSNAKFTFAAILSWMQQYFPSGGGPDPATATPVMDGVGAVGSSTKYAREDHQHPADSNKQDKFVIIGLLKGEGAGGVTAAVPGTDYQEPLTAGTDYQTPLTAGTDYQTPLVAGTDYQTPLTAGTDYQTPLVAGTDYATPAMIPDPPKAGSISLSGTWSGSGPYTQTVTVTGATVTASSKVDIQLTAAQIATLITAGVTAMVIENNNGILTAYAVGAKPSAMTVQVTVTEVST